MPNVLLAETRSQRIDLGLPMLSQLRVSPTVHELLSDAKPDHQSWPDFAIESMVIRVLLPHTLGLRLRELNRQCVRIVGRETDTPGVPSGDSSRGDVASALPDRCQAAPNEPTAVRTPERMNLKAAIVAVPRSRE